MFFKSSSHKHLPGVAALLFDLKTSDKLKYQVNIAALVWTPTHVGVSVWMGSVSSDLGETLVPVSVSCWLSCAPPLLFAHAEPEGREPALVTVWLLPIAPYLFWLICPIVWPNLSRAGM